MITINDLNLQYGDKHLFKNVGGRMNSSDRIGLVGVNGTGKSTLLKMIVGQIETDFGVISRARRTTIGYLPQEVASLPPGRSLYEEAESSFADALNMQSEIDQINRQLAALDPSSPDIAPLLQRQGELQLELDNSDIFRMQSKIEKVLLGLGFKPDDFVKDCHTFSGGWLMRLMLAKLLLSQPTFLLLDEPTNHLDIESLTWLEEFLSTYHGGLLVISHDRAFLDNLTTSTWELSLGKLTIYKGNYSKYITDKTMRMEVTRAAYDNQQAKIQQTMRFVTRFRSKSTKAKQVQSRVKQLAKMEKIEIEDTETQISFRFPPAAPSGRDAVIIDDLHKCFGDKQVFAKLNCELQRGDKMAIVGVNGAGKSTLVKIMAGMIKPDSGAVCFGHNVKVSYFGQHQAQELTPELTALETMALVEADMTMTQTRSLLGAFLFRGDEVDKKVAVLSGGEKSRLALARMIATPANLLIMDEPTNHLDIMSQEVLQEAMGQYDGTIIVVSHNRSFVDGFTNKVLEIRNGRGAMYEGNVSAYLEKTRDMRLGRANQSPGDNSDTAAAAPLPAQKKLHGKEARKETARLRSERNKLIGPHKKNADRLEKSIEELEGRKDQLAQDLANPALYDDQEAFAAKSKEYAALEGELKKKYGQWEDELAKIEEIEQSVTPN